MTMKLFRRMSGFLIPAMLVAAVFSLLILPVVAVAQVAQPTPGPAMPDVQGTLSTLIAALSAAVIPFIVWGIKLVLPRMPRIAIPILVYGLGALAAFLDQMITGGQFNPVLAALIGLGAHAAREIVTTLQSYGVNG